MQSDDVYFYKGIDAVEYEEQFVTDCYDLKFLEQGWLSDYITIDYKRMAEEDNSIYETDEGVLVDRNY